MNQVKYLCIRMYHKFNGIPHFYIMYVKNKLAKGVGETRTTDWITTVSWHWPTRCQATCKPILEPTSGSNTQWRN